MIKNTIIITKINSNKSILIFLTLFIFCNSCFSQVTTVSSAEWLDKFNRYAGFNSFPGDDSFITVYDNDHPSGQAQTARNYWRTLSLRGSVAYYYNGHSENSFEDLSYGLNSLLAAYETTVNETTHGQEYLDELILLCDQLIGYSHNILSEELEAGYHANMTTPFKGYHQYNGQTPNVTEEIKPWRYVLKLCRLIHNNSALWSQSYYRTKIEYYINFINYHIWYKWVIYENTSNNNSYNGIVNINGGCISNIQSNSATIHIASNWAFIAGELYELYQQSNITLVNNFSTQYNLIYSWFNANLFLSGEIVDNCYEFNQILANYKDDECSDKVRSNYWRQLCVGPDDVSHGNFVVSYLIDWIEIYVNDPWSIATNINYLKNTFRDKIWRGCRVAPEDQTMAIWVDGNISQREDCSDPRKDITNTGNDIGEGWVKLGRYSCDVQAIVETYFLNCSSVAESNHSSRVGSYAQMALNAKLLDEFGDNNVRTIAGTEPYNIYYRNGTIETTTIIPSGINTTMAARNSIRLLPGFHAVAGCNFHAFIDQQLCVSQTRLMAVENEPNQNPNNLSDSALTVQNNPNSTTLILDSKGKTNTNSSIVPSKNIKNNGGIENNTLSNPLTITLTPVADNAGQYNVSSNNSQPLYIEVFDAMGRKVFSSNNINTQSSQQISIKPYGTGIYLLKFYDTQGNMAVKKILVN